MYNKDSDGLITIPSNNRYIDMWSYDIVNHIT